MFLLFAQLLRSQENQHQPFLNRVLAALPSPVASSHNGIIRILILIIILNIFLYLSESRNAIQAPVAQFVPLASTNNATASTKPGFFIRVSHITKCSLILF